MGAVGGGGVKTLNLIAFTVLGKDGGGGLKISQLHCFHSSGYGRGGRGGGGW